MAVREFRLPDLGEGLEDAEIVSWRVAEGERVELNQALVEVNTAKALVEIPAPWEGVVEKLHASEGDVVNVGAPLVSIRVEGEETSTPEEIAGAAQQTAQEVGEDAAESAGTDAAAGSDRSKRRAVLVGYGVEDEEETARASRRTSRNREATGGRQSQGPVAASPPVRKLAKEMGIDLATISGSGRGGRVTREDVLKASEGATATAPRRVSPDEERIPVRGTRRLIAEQMARSLREIPHVTTFLTVDASDLQAFRRELEAQSGVRISPLPIVVRALIQICQDHPKLNASFDSERSEIVLHRRINVGIAADTERGLLVPVIRDADNLGLAELSAEIGRLAKAAREGKVKPEEMSGGTITVTNVGTFGAEFGTPIINYPEGAILATGVIEPRALVVDGAVEARPAMTLSLSFDHRLLDGAEAGRALRALGDFMESPFRLGSLPR